MPCVDGKGQRSVSEQTLGHAAPSPLGLHRQSTPAMPRQLVSLAAAALETDCSPPATASAQAQAQAIPTCWRDTAAAHSGVGMRCAAASVNKLSSNMCVNGVSA